MADMEDIAELLQSMLSSDSPEDGDSCGNSSNSYDDGNDFFSGIDIDMIIKMGNVMSKMQEEDKNTALLSALKPHMRTENQEKVDAAIRIMRIMSLIPLIKDMGLLDNFI